MYKKPSEMPVGSPKLLIDEHRTKFGFVLKKT